PAPPAPASVLPARSEPYPVTCTPAENAEVLLTGSVAVAVMNQSGSTAALNVTDKLALPSASVVTTTEPGKHSPCTPDGRAGRVGGAVGEEFEGEGGVGGGAQRPRDRDAGAVRRGRRQDRGRLAVVPAAGQLDPQVAVAEDGVAQDGVAGAAVHQHAVVAVVG